MATLVKERSSPMRQSTSAAIQEDDDLRANVPAPFPRDLAQELLDELAAEDAALGSSDVASGTSRAPARLTVQVPPKNPTVNQEVRPSLTQVEQSCLMTLNNLLSQDADEWQTIVPTRRHSMPAQSPVSTSNTFQAFLPAPTPSSALHTLVTNLRHRYDPSPSPHVVELVDDTSLLQELDTRVRSLIDSGSIQPRDARLAESLVSLLTHLSHVSAISPDASCRSPVDLLQTTSTADIYDTFRQQVLELQTHRDAHHALSNGDAQAVRRPPVQAVEHALLWHNIDSDLDEVFRLCRERTEPAPRAYSPTAPSLPPEYDLADYEPPTYDPAEYSETAAAKAAQGAHRPAPSSVVAPQPQSSVDEKMRLDLEAVTMAIDRLYLVAPQLSNQRAELKGAKLEKVEQARAGASYTVVDNWRASRTRRKGKAKEILGGSRERGATVSGSKVAEEDVQDLEKIVELIGKASTRRIDDQRVALEGEQGMAQRIEKARLRDLAKRDAFHEQLVTHSNAGRLTSQDAVLHASPSIVSLNSRTRNPDALLTLPEFIREGMPDASEHTKDPETLLSLPEFVREPPPASSTTEPGSHTSTSSSKFIKSPFRPSRSRSLSAPPLSLAWLLPGSAANSRTPSPLADARAHSSAQPGMNGRSSPLRAGLGVQYVAEHQENLGSVAVFLRVNGHQEGVDIEAEVFPSGGERLIIKCGASTSAPLALPARVVPGKKEVTMQSGHVELKLECIADQVNGHGPLAYASDAPGTGLLDATQLRTLNPTAFTCASCSLPLVQASRLSRYNDLPSEHWAELLEAWMCHSDQHLADRIASYATGLWPAPGQALVGGSYILFESSSLVPHNFRFSEPKQTDGPDDWQPVRCICGAVTGRCRRHASSPDNEAVSFTYRLAKFAIRPVGPSSDSIRIPLSAFVLQDMDEFVQAHATYRFVLLDDEEEKPRILIWMFNPHIRLSYATSTHSFISRSASIRAAKVHFKILGPSVSPTFKSTVEKYPGFGQSERLLYPLNVCQRLAGLLRESNTAYPQGRRIMGGLDVGWLLRA